MWLRLGVDLGPTTSMATCECASESELGASVAADR